MITLIARNSFLIIATILLTTACARLPETTRTSVIHDVKITKEGVSPRDLAVQPGDEVRWVNHRAAPVRVEFLGGRLDEVSCQRGFSNLNLIGIGNEHATIEPNEAVSLCFSKGGLVKYSVRMDAVAPGGEVTQPAEIRVGSGSKP